VGADVGEQGRFDEVAGAVEGQLPAAGEQPGALALGLHPDVDCLVFTGSTQVGKYFMGYSAQSNLKQVWL
ncbi:aldehyde dehydrogenase family protein, partial [Pseudomonas otitidis]